MARAHPSTGTQKTQLRPRRPAASNFWTKSPKMSSPGGDGHRLAVQIVSHPLSSQIMLRVRKFTRPSGTARQVNSHVLDLGRPQKKAPLFGSAFLDYRIIRPWFSLLPCSRSISRPTCGDQLRDLVILTFYAHEAPSPPTCGSINLREDGSFLKSRFRTWRPRPHRRHCSETESP